MNKKLLSISFFISLLLWFYVQNSESQIVVKEIPLTIITPEGKSVARLSSEKLKIKIKGTKFFLKQIHDFQPRYELNIAQTHKRHFTYSLESKNIALPFGTELIEMNPSKVKVKLSRTIKKMIPLKAQFFGELKENLILENVKLLPKKIEVQGAYEPLKRLKFIQTLPIDLDKVRFTSTLKTLPSRPGSLFRLNLETPIEVQLKIKKPKRRLKVGPLVPKIAQNLEILDKEFSLTLDVLVPDDVDIDPKQLKARLITPSDKTGALKAKVEVELPKDVELLRIYPEYIKVFVPRL